MQVRADKHVKYLQINEQRGDIALVTASLAINCHNHGTKVNSGHSDQDYGGHYSTKDRCEMCLTGGRKHANLKSFCEVRNTNRKIEWLVLVLCTVENVGKKCWRVN